MITVVNTESGQSMDVVDLTPTKNGQAYAGNVMGREIVYHRSREQVQADLDRVNPALKVSRKFKK